MEIEGVKEQVLTLLSTVYNIFDVRYSSKIALVFLVTLVGLVLPLHTNQWMVWIAYILGFVLSIILVVQVLSKNAYGPLFKTVVYKFNRWVSLDDKENNQTNSKNNLFTSGGVAGVFGMLAYLALKMFVDIGVISTIGSEAIISFLLGALAGLFLTVAHLAHLVEKKFNNACSKPENISRLKIFVCLSACLVFVSAIFAVTNKLTNKTEFDEILSIFTKTKDRYKSQLFQDKLMDVPWISDDGFDIYNKEEIGLELRVMCNSSNSNDDAIYKEVVQNIVSQLDKVVQKHGYSLSQNNSSEYIGDYDKFIDYIRAYETNDLKVVFNADLSCYNDTEDKSRYYRIFTISYLLDFDTNYQEQIKYLKDLDINGAIGKVKRSGDFIVLSILTRKPSGPYIIAKLINNKWESLYTGHDYPECEKIRKYNIPHDLLSHCWVVDGDFLLDLNTVIDLTFQNNQTNVLVQLLNLSKDSKNLATNVCNTSSQTLEEMSDKNNNELCWHYVSETDAYYLNYPSERYKITLITQEELNNKLQFRTSYDPATKTTLTTGCKTPTTRKINDKNFLDLSCQSTYKYMDDRKQTIKGIASDFTQCLYKFKDNTYFYYGTEYASSGSTIDNCQTLENAGLSVINTNHEYESK